MMCINKAIYLLLGLLLFLLTTGIAIAKSKTDLAKTGTAYANTLTKKPVNNQSSDTVQKPDRKTPDPEKISPQLKEEALIPRLVNIPAGCFQMGSPETEQGRSADEALHRVCVKGFKLTRNEITVEEFSRFITTTNFITDAEHDAEEAGCWSYQKGTKKAWDWQPWATWKKPVQESALIKKEPVTCVSLNDVMAYIEWLNRETGQQYRLPTEAEWEYAARAGTATARYWGNNPDITCSYANVADNTMSGSAKWPETHNCADGYFFAATVSALRANKFDLHDMLGNVWEWTCSKYEEKYVGNEASCIDKKIPDDVLISVRGGGWNAEPARTRAASRNWGLAWSRQANLGFRLVRDR